MTDWQSDVRDFQKKFGYLVADEPSVPPADTVDLRVRLIIEEIVEMLIAIQHDDLIELADGIADLIYVLLGTANAFGIDMNRVWQEVHRSNMEKVKQPGDKPLKPEGWRPPDVAGVLGIPPTA